MVIEVSINGKEMKMAILNGLFTQYKHIITALDDLEDETPKFTLDIVKSRQLYENQQRGMRQRDTSEPILFSANCPIVPHAWPYLCSYC